MLDFLYISVESSKKGITVIKPEFKGSKSKDLMIRGGDFYAIWCEDRGLWSTDEQDALDLIDRELDIYVKENADNFVSPVKIDYMWRTENGRIARWHSFCQKDKRDGFHMLDETLTFSNTVVTRETYASKRLSYPLEEGSCPCYVKLMSTLYSPEERHKLEWAIGAIVTGDSRYIQKFIVLYGPPGTGKSTVLHIIEKLFKGYCSVFDSKALSSSNNNFALESLRENPLVAIQHDGDLSRIEDNTRLNSLVSHETMSVNVKNKSAYSMQFKSFLILGTNKPVKITDAKSGLLRRLIDVSPSGNKLAQDDYDDTVKQIDFELGAIAYHCREVYMDAPDAYNRYVPLSMMEASNDFYNFVDDSSFIFKKEDGVTLKTAWEMYKNYCEEAKVPYPYSYRVFREELKNYFSDCKDRCTLEDGTRVRSYYCGFLWEKFEPATITPSSKPMIFFPMDAFESLLDKELADCPAQYANDEGKPWKAWDNVTTTLKDIDTSKLHYVRLPANHIVIDFDIPDENGGKCLEKNLEAASKWPATYAELSKSGQGVHLHYIYSGDVTKLSPVYGNHIEVKVFQGKSSLRRKVTKCNDIPIATLSSGLPLREEKGEKNTVNEKQIKSERALRTQIQKNLMKEIHPSTTQSMNFIKKILDDAYASDLQYDISDMAEDIFLFACDSTHQSEYCKKVYGQLHLKSKDYEAEAVEDKDKPMIFYDVEVFPNLFVICWKKADEEEVHSMINPNPEEVRAFMLSGNLIGFNNRRYDNHILYGRGVEELSLQGLYELSQRIITKGEGFYGGAYNVSYTDIYDFCSKKQSLKKWEIELGIHHQELGLPWDQPVPEELWDKVAEYCCNDVEATQAVFEARQSDFIAREVLADVAGATVNDTTNSLTQRIIFGNNRHPQSEFNYRNMGDESQIVTRSEDGWTCFDAEGRPIFPGYVFENGQSTYRGEIVGEGGYVYSEPGMYGNVALLDIASQHPNSLVNEKLLGEKYTQRFNDILQARIAIKHKDFDKAKTMLDGKLAKYLTDESKAADLAQALKIAVNSVYGLTSAKFDNPFRDIRNVDNIVAKRGALFMINLKHEIQKRGFTVVHVKTDSVKVADATPDIIQFVMDYGKLYGYNFEHEETYDRMCLVNKAVYIAKYQTPHKDKKTGADIWWTATGAQFQVPYVFKTLFSGEDTTFDDICETKEVKKGAIYLDMNEGLPEDEHDYCFVGRVGLFCPIKPGCGGGVLTCINGEKYSAVSGTKGYRWLESEEVRKLHKKADVDISYYKSLVDATVNEISKYGDFDWFVSDRPYVGPNYDEQGRPIYDDLPF